MDSKNRIPSFFKILLDHTSPKEQLPPVFVKKVFLGGGVLEGPMLLEINSGNKWRVKIEKDGDAFYFTKGWPDFVKDTNTETGDLLAFKMINYSTFKVSIYAAEKDSSFVIPKSCTNDQEIDSEEDNALRTLSKNLSFKKVIKKSDSRIMRFPMEFVNGSGMWKARERPASILVTNISGRGRDVKLLYFGDGRVSMGNGWLMFRTENKIADGDACIFKYFSGDQGGSGSSFFQVEVVKEEVM